MKYFLIISLLVSSLSFGEADAKCHNALNACIEYNNALKQESAVLKNMNGLLLQQRDEALQKAAENAKNPLLPAWAWFGIGFLAGTTTVLILK